MAWAVRLPGSLASARVSSGGSCTHASIHASTYQTLKALQQYRVLGDVLHGHLADRVEDHAMQLGQPAAAGAAAAAGALAALAGALPPRAAASASRLAFLAARLEGWPSVGFAPDPPPRTRTRPRRPPKRSEAADGQMRKLQRRGEVHQLGPDVVVEAAQALVRRSREAELELLVHRDHALGSDAPGERGVREHAPDVT